MPREIERLKLQVKELEKQIKDRDKNDHAIADSASRYVLLSAFSLACVILLVLNMY